MNDDNSENSGSESRGLFYLSKFLLADYTPDLLPLCLRLTDLFMFPLGLYWPHSGQNTH